VSVTVCIREGTADEPRKGFIDKTDNVNSKAAHTVILCADWRNIAITLIDRRSTKARSACGISPGLMATSNSVFLNMDGHDVLKANKHWFNDAVEKAGIRDFTWHCLRHTFASRLVMAGVDIRTV
jgi:integrase